MEPCSIEFDESEYLHSDFSDEALLQIAGLCGPWTANQLLLPDPVPIKHPAGVKLRACMTRWWNYFMRFGGTAFLFL